MKQNLLLTLLLLGYSFNSFAGEAKVLNIEEKVEINAPAAKVWEKVSNFGDLGTWHPAVAKTELKYGSNNKRGAARQLTLKDGGVINELLLTYNAEKMSYRYAIVDGVLPVSQYVSSIAVKPEGANKTVVTWKGKFKRKDLSDPPAQGQDDETAIKTIKGVYRAGLDNLKKITE